MNSSDLGFLTRSRIPILLVDSVDEVQLIKTILRTNGHAIVAVKPVPVSSPKPAEAPPAFQCTVTDGLKRLDVPFSTR
jgi:hypothetical protein